MVDPNPNNDEFYTKALASFNQQMALANNNNNNNNNAAAAANEIETYAKSLVEDDLPKIDSAIKSYLSLVAARSTVASDIDVISTTSSALLTDTTKQCTFASCVKTPLDANRCALMCARTLLSTINSTIIPPESISEGGRSTIIITNSNDDDDDDDETNNNNEEEKMKGEVQTNAARILWNRLVGRQQQQQQSSNGSAATGDKKAKQTKPSRVLGRESLHVAYPYIEERLRRGILLLNNDNNGADAVGANDDDDDYDDASKPVLQTNPLHSFSNEILPPVKPPKGIDIDQWEAFFVEFRSLLDRACSSSITSNSSSSEKEPQSTLSSKVDDDSALLWSSDKGVAELRLRREMRAQRATEALSSVEGAKAVVADAVLG